MLPEPEWLRQTGFICPQCSSPADYNWGNRAWVCQNSECEWMLEKDHPTIQAIRAEDNVEDPQSETSSSQYEEEENENPWAGVEFEDRPASPRPAPTEPPESVYDLMHRHDQSLRRQAPCWDMTNNCTYNGVSVIHLKNMCCAQQHM